MRGLYADYTGGSLVELAENIVLDASGNIDVGQGQNNIITAGRTIRIGTHATQQNINIGTGNVANVIVIGNATAGTAASTTIHAGTGGLSLATTDDIRTIDIATGNAKQTVNIANHTTPANEITIGGTNSLLGFFGTNVEAQITTSSGSNSVSPSAMAGVAGTAVTTTNTFEGYTIGEVVKALQVYGLLA